MHVSLINAFGLCRMCKSSVSLALPVIATQADRQRKESNQRR